jgi:hypothetical protein
MQLARKPDAAITEHELLDQVESRLLSLGGVVRARGGAIHGIPQVHRFTPGLYVREIRMPAGSVLTTETWKHEHPFVVSAGIVNVYNALTDQWETITAPHTGITKPGTRRLLVVIEDTVWSTFHVTNTTDIDELESELWEERGAALRVVEDV